MYLFFYLFAGFIFYRNIFYHSVSSQQRVQQWSMLNLPKKMASNIPHWQHFPMGAFNYPLHTYDIRIRPAPEDEDDKICRLQFVSIALKFLLRWTPSVQILHFRGSWHGWRYNLRVKWCSGWWNCNFCSQSRVNDRMKDAAHQNWNIKWFFETKK